MRIEVTMPVREFEEQTRAYAEYRIFSALTRHRTRVEHAHICLGRPPGSRDSAVCVVGVTLADGTRTRIRARGRHAYDAINRAADRASDALRIRADLAMTT